MYLFVMVNFFSTDIIYDLVNEIFNLDILLFLITPLVDISIIIIVDLYPKNLTENKHLSHFKGQTLSIPLIFILLYHLYSYHTLLHTPSTMSSPWDFNCY